MIDGTAQEIDGDAGRRSEWAQQSGSVLPAASALAKRRVIYGAKPEHYPVVGSALLWTLEKGLGDGWTPEVADAWTAAYGTLSRFMISEAYGRAQAAK
ncbi:MAG TPA: globin domain-containing protein [Steroidobacteraceae bacterium]|jgi:nitric oxide dioxygenase|nr:globin domain-containing protein [Steroidobacteraceae bacterium]